MAKCDIRWNTGNGFRSNYGQIKSAVSRKTFYQYSQDIVGKWIGRLLSFLIIGYFLTTSAFQIRSMAEVISFCSKEPHMGYCYAFYVDRSLFDYEWY